MQFPFKSQALTKAVPAEPKAHGLVFKFNLADLNVDLSELAACVLSSFKRLPDDFELHRGQQLAFLESELSMSFSERDRSRYLVQGQCAAVSMAISKLSRADLKLYSDIGPTRFRRLARYVASARNGKAAIGRMPVNTFDPEAANRHGSQDFLGFSEVEDSIASHPAILEIVKYFCEKIFQSNPSTKRIDVAMHQMHVLATQERPFIMPEGIHQKGCDYTIPELVMGNINMQSPNSTIYDCTNNILVYAHLKEGEGLFHDDRVHWHGVSGMLPARGHDMGHRLSFGFDFYLS